MRTLLPRGFSSGTFNPRSSGAFDFAAACRTERSGWFRLAARLTRWRAFVVVFAVVAVMLLPSGAAGQSATHRVAPTTARSAAPTTAAVAGEYGRLPLSFEVNDGQIAREVQFLARGSGYSLFLTEDAAVLSLMKDGAGSHGQRRAAAVAAAKTDVIRMELVGASADPKLSGVEPLAGKANYLIGNDPSKWHTGVPTYARVKYARVYPGVDLVYYGNQRQLEYDFVVAPGANARDLRVRFDGARKLRIGADGNLRIVARNGEIAFQKPVAYQLRDGRRELVDGRFVKSGKNEVGFALGNYDATRELVIDPVLAYSTYLGGSGGDSAVGIAVDAEGSAYVTGNTNSTDFPLKGNSYQKTNKGVANGFGNVFVTKMNTAGSGLDYSTYLGGSGHIAVPQMSGIQTSGGDSAGGIAIDAYGNAYVTGATYSTDFPVTTGAFQTTNNGLTRGVSNAFVTKLNVNGSALVYSTYLGGSGAMNFMNSASTVGDGGSAIAVDSAGNAYVTGAVYSQDFPVTSGAFQKVNNAAGEYSDNVFISKINAAGSALIYSTYLGGSAQGFNFVGSCQINCYGDSGAAIALDSNGNAYVTGTANSTDFPVTDGAFQRTNNDGPLEESTAFVAKLNAAGSALVYSTYVGGSGTAMAGEPTVFGDEANAIAIDRDGDAYVAGATYSADFPITSLAFQASNKGFSGVNPTAFVTEFNPTGSGLVFSTFLGGTGGDVGTGIVLDGAGEVFLTGSTGSADFPVTSDAFQTSGSGTFISELSANFEKLVYSTFFGGSFGAAGIAMDPAGNIYVAGGTDSENFPTTHEAFQHKIAGNVAYVAKFAVNSTAVPTSMILDANFNPQLQGKTITFTAQVTTEGGDGQPTGEVHFGIDGGLPSVKDLDSTGRASFQTNALPGGTHAVTALYVGDGTFAPSTTSYVETVLGTNIDLSLVSGANQRGVYGTTFANPLVFEVTEGGLPRAGIAVTFTSSNLHFSSLKESSGANGEVSVYATASASGNLEGEASAAMGIFPAGFAMVANKAVLTVTAKNVSVPQGKPIPPLTYSITGFLNGDKASVVSGAPTLSTVVEGAAEGSYPITVALGSLAATNYAFKLVDGTLTITSAGTVAKPVFTPDGNVFSSPPMVKMTDATPGAAIYYTTDGTMPTTKSTLYTAPITVTKTEVIEAIGVASGYVNSAATIQNYRVE
jgi:Bacterial Ig-like domain (group 3)/MBG domain (YGX type)/Chitobiase/beta-hexosaminidase C-terminal domain/Beta-propeller repeat